MFTVWVVFHVIVSVALVLVVLMQSSKGEGLAGSAFGGGSGLSGAVFGGRGAATFLSKATTYLAVLFMLNCGALAYMSAGQRVGVSTGAAGTPESVVTREAQREMERQMQQPLQQGTTPDSGLIFEPPAGATDTASTTTDTSGK